jgi:hypothetical protein
MKLYYFALTAFGATVGSAVSTVVNGFTGIAILFWAVAMASLVALVPVAYWSARKRAIQALNDEKPIE